MRALKRLKRDAMKLKQEAEMALFLLQGSKAEFKSNPCQKTWDEMEEAEESYKRAHGMYESCLSCIRDYDFYRECERQEQEMEARREAYLQYC